MQTKKKNLVDPILVIIGAFDKGELLYTVEINSLEKIDPQQSLPWAKYHGHIRNAFWIRSVDLYQMNSLAKSWYSNMEVVHAKKQHFVNND